MADEHSSSDSTSISSVGSSSESTNHSPASPTHPPSKPSRHSLPTVHVDDDSRSIDDDDDELTDLSSASPTTEQTGIKWTPEMELVLFQAIFKYQPVGVHRRFRMISIMLHCERNMPIRVSRGDVWDRLESLYNLKELDRLTDETDAAEDTSGTFGSAELSISRSIYPFLVEQEFQLPFEDFEGLIAEHRKASTPESDAGDLASSQSSSSVRPSSSIEVSATDPGRGFRGGMQSPLSPRLAAQRLKNRPMSPVRIKTPELEEPPVVVKARRGRKPKSQIALEAAAPDSPSALPPGVNPQPSEGSTAGSTSDGGVASTPRRQTRSTSAITAAPTPTPKRTKRG